MMELEHVINELASDLAEDEVLSAQENAEALHEEVKIHGYTKLNMIAWDQNRS